jgi:hypothetical protein
VETRPTIRSESADVVFVTAEVRFELELGGRMPTSEEILRHLGVPFAVRVETLADDLDRDETDPVRRVCGGPVSRESAVAEAIERVIDDDADLARATNAALPATQEELAYWCLQHPAPGMLIRTVPEPNGQVLAADSAASCLGITWPYAPSALDGHLATRSTRASFGPVS